MLCVTEFGNTQFSDGGHILLAVKALYWGDNSPDKRAESHENRH